MSVSCQVWCTDGISNSMKLDKKELTNSGKRVWFIWTADRPCVIKEYVITDGYQHTLLNTAYPINLGMGDSFMYTIDLSEDWDQ